MTSRMRSLGIAFCIVAVLAGGSCMESIEPTPQSTLVSIEPGANFVSGLQTDSTTRFLMPLVIRNRGSRAIYLDLGYRRTEKLIDQKWENALEMVNGNFVSIRVINPGRTVTIDHVVAFRRGFTDPAPLLEHIRGLYRVRLRFSYTSNGTDLLSVDDSYSRPFAVTE